MQNELIHIERIASLGRLSSSVAHEINNPLSGALTYTKLVHKQLSRLRLDDEVKTKRAAHNRRVPAGIKQSLAALDRFSMGADRPLLVPDGSFILTL